MITIICNKCSTPLALSKNWIMQAIEADTIVVNCVRCKTDNQFIGQVVAPEELKNQINNVSGTDREVFKGDPAR